MKTKLSLLLIVMAFMLIGAATDASAQEYITEVMTIGIENGDGKKVRTEYENKGWTVINSDLNAGAGGYDIYICYKTSSTASPWDGYITDICVTDHENGDTLMFEGRTYYRVANNKGFNGDLNRDCGSKTAYIVAYYTRDRYKLRTFGGDKRVMTKLSVTHSSDDGDSRSAAISWRNTKKSSYKDLANVNQDAGGSTIYIHQHFAEQTLKWKKKPTFAKDLTFNGSTQILITDDTWKENEGRLVYRVNGGPWSTSLPAGYDVGTYKVEACLEGIKTSHNIWFANNSEIVKETVTIHPPIVSASNLKGVFNQGDKRVYLSWETPSIPGDYADFKWVIYRDGTKIAELASNVHTYSDSGYTNEANPVYNVYYVPNFWDINTRRDDTKASVTLSTTRTVPINGLMVEQEPERVVFTWTSDAYPKGFGHEFRIYAGDEEDPIYKLTPADMQTAFRWEHRTTDQHNNQQSFFDPETGVHYTEEPLNACAPRPYRIEGVIGNVLLNAIDIKPKAIGEATKLYYVEASKGVYEGSVKLSWHVDQRGSLYAKTYIVERRRAEQVSEAWEVLTRLSSNEDYLFYTDETALPGVFYEYRITVEDKCDDGSTVSSEKANIGFAKSIGTLTGRIAYGSTGTAVQGVDVVMTMTSTQGNSIEQFHSLYFTDLNGTVTWQYPSEKYAAEKFTDGDFTIQMWLYPEAFSDATIANFGGGFGLRMTADGGLAFSDGSTTHPFQDIKLQANRYNHVALTRSGSTLNCYVMTIFSTEEDLVVQKATMEVAFNQSSLLNAQQFELGHFKGSADEFRLWTKCLTEADVMENYDHLLVGNEQHLETYWTFDEGLRTQFFDYSRDGTNYRKHHGMVGSNVQPSTLTPSVLKLKAKTDADGNYIIHGIPFTGEGTTYSVIPLYGAHEFSPNKALRFVGRNALIHTADFEDVSSFPMSGYIYYAGTNVPIEGVQMYVDGMLQNKDGQVVQTNSMGQYTVSVPIGHHFVEARLGGHTMVEGGRWPTQGTFYFDRPVQHDFADSTLVNFVGRVGGGLSNDTLAVGFGLSKNNIGIATIELALNNESFSFNCQDDHISNALTERTWQSDTTSINSHTHTGFNEYETKYITIRTDSLTGEFSALLPPLKYTVRSIKIDNNLDIDFGSLPEIDLTFVSQEQTDEFTETFDDGTELKRSYTYNTKMVKTYFAEPQLELIQMTLNGDGDAPKGVFGRKSFEEFTDDFGTTPIDNIWTIDDSGNTAYAYGYPIYDGGDKVKMRVWGYEVYVNNDAKDLPAVADTLALNGQVVTISNEMSDEQMVVARVDNDELGLQPGDIYDLKKDQLILDAKGMNEFSFTTGLPNIAAPYTRQLSMEMVRNDRTYTYDGMNAIVLGSLTTGTNFITLGPDKVVMVLRDPPGANSKTTWTSGTVMTKMSSEAHGFYGDESITFTKGLGASTGILNGVGVIVEAVKAQEITSDTYGTHYRVNRIEQTDETWSVTATKAISTGTGSTYLGANGDVYIGASTNIIIGSCRKLGFYRAGADYPFELDLKNALSMNDSITTTFMYSAYEIEKVMIPKWESTRSALFTFLGSKDEAKNFVNTSDHCVYTTWLKADDPILGEVDTTYFQIPPRVRDNKAYADSVAWCTNQIHSWRDIMAQNEKDKLDAINNQGYFRRNISFDGGAPNSYTSRRDTTYQNKHIYNHNWGIIFNTDNTADNTFTDFTTKLAINIKTENGWSMSTADSDEDENTKNWAQFDYTFSDGNKGTDFSVNIYKSPSGWSDSFFVVGGQSYNPYEGEEKTKWFEKDQHVLSNGTQQMEMPNMRISLDGNADNSAKEVTLSDVPAGQTGQLTLHLTNLTNTNQGFDFSYNIAVQEKANQMGLEILMDGVPANGRSVFIPAGETVKKVITVRQTDQSVLDYEDLELRFCSQYQPVKIYDAVKFNVHFVPSSSPVDLAISEPVLNIETLDNNKGDLILKVSSFDRQFKGMKKVGVEYRFEGSTVWIRPDTLTFVVNRADSTNLHSHVLPATGDLRLRLNMKDDNSYPQGNYTFRAYTTTQYGTDDINVYSSEISVVKDNMRPRNLTTPLPADGILRYGDDIVVEFNEDIVPGYVDDKNIIVTAKLNSQPVHHEVAKLILPYTMPERTVNPIFRNGDFSIDLWMQWHDPGAILRFGEGQLVLSIDEEGHIVISTYGSQVKSGQVIPKNTWTYLVVSYRSADKSFTALGQYENVTLPLLTNAQVENAVAADKPVVYSDDNYLYLGDMYGAIHDLSLYCVYRDVYEAAATKYQAKDNYVYGLANYWPMNEGHGFVAGDTRHTHDFEVNDTWQLDNKNYAIQLYDGKGFEADISSINTGNGDSYAIELWTYVATMPQEGSSATIFEAGSSDDNRLELYINAQKDWVLRHGQKEQVVVSHNDFPNTYWNHVALNVVRGQAASFYLNGKRMDVIAETEVPPLMGSRMKIGKGLSEYSRIDEVRIWHAALSESRLLDNQYNCIDTTENYSRGLVAYYPFEKAGTVNGVDTKVSTLEDMAPKRPGGAPDVEIIPQGEYWMGTLTPPLKNAPVESRLIAKPVASERKIVIRLEEGSGITARDVEGTMLNITVDKIHDMHGNESLPIRWQAFCQLNTLKWMKDTVNIIKSYGDDYTFDVNIENRGGNTEYYSLYNMPQWLTLVGSERTDNLAPQKTKTLRFQVSPMVAVGNYDVTIGLQGNNEILEPLRIVMNVKGQKPAWTVDPKAYENTMSVVGQIYLNGILMGNSESLLAAFIGNECRGVASPKQIREAAYVAMSVYGTAQQTVNGEPADLDKGLPVTFRFWDATNGITYTNVNVIQPDSSATDALTFDPTMNYGNFDTPIIFTKSNLIEQPLNIRTGWNWLALGVEPAKPKVSAVFQDVVTWNAQLKDKNTGVAYCRGSYWAGSMKEVHANTMYKLLLSRLENSKALPQPLIVNGEQVKLSETPVIIGKGWNWIAYTPMTTIPIAEALAGANPKAGDQVKSQTEFAYFSSHGWEGNLEALESGKGYLYHSVDIVKKQFVYPTIAATSRSLRAEAPKSKKRAASAFPPVEPTDYPDNMTMVIQLTSDDTPVTDAEIAAFIDGECRGTAFADDGLYYLLVAGEGSGQPIEIRANIYGSIQTVCNSLTYMSDGSIGTPWEPFVIDVSVSTGIKTAYGQMADGVWYTLQGIRYGTSKPTTPGVYLFNGQKVVVKRKTDTSN